MSWADWVLLGIVLFLMAMAIRYLYKVRFTKCNRCACCYNPKCGECFKSTKS